MGDIGPVQARYDVLSDHGTTDTVHAAKPSRRADPEPQSTPAAATMPDGRRTAAAAARDSTD
jgi:hypothetical protein